ncbi:MAG: TIGR03067 domain-containing protein [Sedimentisphaerales bacterium]|nr:TIGR03067 domain-containing protein [Sedimentisphaerales bacterium]
MSLRRIFLVIAVLLAVSSVPAGAQVKLGDVVAENGYDWIIGKWAATRSDDQQVELEYKWILDKYAMCVDVKIGDFKYHGMIMGVPSREEIIQIGADNMGGTWNGTWAEDYEGAVNRNQRLETDGTSETMDMVFVKVDNNSFKVKEYSVESGYRASQVRGETIFKRQKEQTAQKAETDSGLEGTWTGADAGGYGGQWTFVFSKGKVEVKGPESEYYAGTMKLNDKTSPKQIDFKIDKCSMPEYAGETSLSIYRLEGNKLTLAASEPGSMYRPTFFDSTGGVMLFSLTRK